MKNLLYPNLAFDERTGVDYWESVYDHDDFSGYCYRQRLETALTWLDSLHLSDQSRILDVGCGTGRFISEIIQRGYKLHGVDSSRGMLVKAIDACKKNAENRTVFVQADTEYVPIRAASFDVIVCLGVVAYLKDERKALEEFSRIIKPGGLLIISIVNKARLAPRIDIPLMILNLVRKIFHRMDNIFSKDTSTIKNIPVRSYSIPRFRRALANADFNTLEFKTVPIKLPTFFGKPIYSQKAAEELALTFEQSTKIPIVESLGGMCIFKAQNSISV